MGGGETEMDSSSSRTSRVSVSKFYLKTVMFATLLRYVKY